MIDLKPIRVPADEFEPYGGITGEISPGCVVAQLALLGDEPGAGAVPERLFGDRPTMAAERVGVGSRNR